MITLKIKHFIASGAFCHCYEHPATLSECIKTPTSASKAQKRIADDVKYYKHLQSSNTNMRYIADYLGPCESNLGKGHRYECIRDADSKISKTLDFYLNSPSTDLGKLYRQLSKLAQYLVSNRIMISDLHTKNILIQVNCKGEISPIIIDGIGDRVAIPILNKIPSLLESKIIRRWNRFSDKYLTHKHHTVDRSSL